MTEPEPRRELDGQLSMPIAVTVYNRRPYYPATECAGTSVEGDGVRAAARPHPTRRINLNGGGGFTLTAHHGHVRLVCHEGVARGVPFDLTPDEMRIVCGHGLGLADLAQLPETGA